MALIQSMIPMFLTNVSDTTLVLYSVGDEDTFYNFQGIHGSLLIALFGLLPMELLFVWMF